MTLSDDGKLRLWNVATRKLIGAPLPASDTGGSVHFFPDGKHVLGVFASGTGIVWSVDPAAWAAKACSIAHRNLTPGEWTEFLGHRGYQARVSVAGPEPRLSQIETAKISGALGHAVARQ